MKTRNQTRTAFALAAAAMASILPAGADPITIPNAGFEERETFDAFPDGTDKYNQFALESWRHFELPDNGGPLRIWNPGDPANPAHLTTQGIADVGFEGNAPEGKYMVVVRSRQNDPARTFEAAVQLLPETFDSTMTYTLTAKVGRLPDGEAEGGSVNYSPDWFGYSLQFAVGGTNVDGARFAGQVTGGTILAEDRNSSTVPVNGFVTATVTYTPNPADSVHDGEPIQIRLCALETPVNPEDDTLAGWVAFDDVTLDAVLGPPSKMQLDLDKVGDDLVISWPSQGGMLYNLRSETDPSAADPKEWPIYEGNEDLEATPPTNTLTIPFPADSSRYFVIEEFLAPPEVVFGDDLESGIGGWTTGSDGAAGTAWELGQPSNVGPAEANSPLNCFATNLQGDYELSANVWLRSPPIDLTLAGSATLNYAQFKDIEEGFDSGSVAVLDAAGDSELAVIEAVVDGITADWELVTRAIPAVGLGKIIKLEFRFASDDIGNFAGWYIDDVEVTIP